MNRLPKVLVRFFTSWTAWLVCFLEEPILNTLCPLRERERKRTYRQIPCSIGAQTQHLLLACDWWFLVLGTLQVLFHQFGCNADNVLTLPVLNHIERLQGAYDVTLCDAGHLAEEKSAEVASRSKQQETNSFCVCVPEILDGQRSPEVPQDLQQDPGPVTSVAQLSQVRERLLWRANRVFQL